VAAYKREGRQCGRADEVGDVVCTLERRRRTNKVKGALAQPAQPMGAVGPWEIAFLLWAMVSSLSQAVHVVAACGYGAPLPAMLTLPRR
jgi:hypothetical protein